MTALGTETSAVGKRSSTGRAGSHASLQIDAVKLSNQTEMLLIQPNEQNDNPNYLPYVAQRASRRVGRSLTSPIPTLGDATRGPIGAATAVLDCRLLMATAKPPSVYA